MRSTVWRTLDIHDYVRIFRRQLVLILATTVIGLSIGALVAMLTPARYSTSTQVMVRVTVSDTATPAERTQATSYAQQVIETYRSLVTGSLVLDPVIEDLDLPTTTAALASRVQASAALRSTMLTISVTHTNPGQAARIANAVADSFATTVTDTLEKRKDDASYSVSIVTIEPAQVPTTPSAPNMQLSLIVGGLLGLGAGVAIALLRAVLDRRIITRADLESALDAPVLGSIPHDLDAAETPLIVTTAPKSLTSEAFRTLRTNLQFFMSGDPGVFVVTSSGPGEGKSTTAANLAITFAEAGLRTAIIDGDLRLPRIADYFGVEGVVGLTDVLVGRASLNDVMQRWGRGTLFALPAGTVPPNPAELLGSDAMGTTLEVLTEAFDVVIIDAPPLLLVTDAAVIARRATGAVLVAASGSTTQPRYLEAAKSLDAVGARLLGTVLTMAPAPKASITPAGDATPARR